VTAERWQRIKSVFQTAVDLPAGERDAYLAAETGADRDLRTEVEKMLRHATGAGPLDTPAFRGLRLENPIEPGAYLGPYEILEEVGAGGMGRVYKARDTRLGRIVAMKVLSAEFSHRLRIEGRAISALNHPHVCALYDIGDQNGTAYLVMEYVEGESLAARLAKGRLPLQEVLRYGAEIASALTAAHAQGIVHRDLKPANIMITASGAKVLDFGVARIEQDEETAARGVVGTAAYMSPSQLNGNPADARSDIFAAGLVLYEMATGTRPAPGVPREMENVPVRLASLIDQCLQENAAHRVQRMEELQAALEQLRAQLGTEPEGVPMKPRWIFAGIAAAVLAAVLWRFGPTPVPRVSETKTSAAVVQQQAPPSLPTPVPAAKVEAPAPQEVEPAPPPPPSLTTLVAYPGIQRDPTFSPDGKRVAFAWHVVDRPGFAIFVRKVKTEELPTRLTEVNGEDWGPAWSPDGRKIAFRRKAAWTGIYWVPSAGGDPTLISRIAQLNSETLPQMSWSRDGKWIASPDRDQNGVTQIYLFSVATGDRRALTASANGATNHAPAFSPNGKSLAYAACRGTVFPCDIVVLDLDRALVPTQQSKINDRPVYVRGLAWTPDGKSLVYSANRGVSTSTSLWRVAVNPPGQPELLQLAGSQARHPAISNTRGLLAYTKIGDWKLMLIENFR
jgi:serine/threonine protein kinase